MTARIYLHPACRPRLVTADVEAMFQASVATDLGHFAEAAEYQRKAWAAQDRLAALNGDEASQSESA